MVAVVQDGLKIVAIVQVCLQNVVGGRNCVVFTLELLVNDFTLSKIRKNTNDVQMLNDLCINLKTITSV